LKPEQMIGYVIFLIIALIVAAITIPSIFAEIGPYHTEIIILESKFYLELHL